MSSLNPVLSTSERLIERSQYKVAYLCKLLWITHFFSIFAPNKKRFIGLSFFCHLHFVFPQDSSHCLKQTLPSSGSATKPKVQETSTSLLPPRPEEPIAQCALCLGFDDVRWGCAHYPKIPLGTSGPHSGCAAATGADRGHSRQRSWFYRPTLICGDHDSSFTEQLNLDMKPGTGNV